MRGVRAAAGALIAATAVGLLAGCASPTASLESSIAQSGAAVRSAALAVDERVDGRATQALTLTAVEDALREATDAETGIEEVRPTADADVALRDEALTAARDAITDLLAAQLAVERQADLGDIARALAARGEALSALEDDLGSAAP